MFGQNIFTLLLLHEFTDSFISWSLTNLWPLKQSELKMWQYKSGYVTAILRMFQHHEQQMTQSVSTGHTPSVSTLALVNLPPLPPPPKKTGEYHLLTVGCFGAFF
jgi:hypothetical protein